MESKGVMTFCDKDFPCISFAAFEDMRRTGELCDVRITVNDHHLVLAHRVILAAAIPYFRSYSGFRSMSTGNGVNGEWEVSLENLDPRAVETLIQFAYSGRVSTSTENVHSLLLASDYLQINQVRDACVEFLSDNFNISNVVETHMLAHSLNDLTLIESSNSYIRENFEEFSKSDNFLSVSDECVKEIISNDFLNVSCETVVFEAVIRWVRVSLSERQDILPELLSEVRLIYLPTGYFDETVASEELIRASSPCKDIIERVKSYHLRPEKEAEFLNLKTRPRKSLIYGVHKWGDIVHYFDFTSKSWYKMKSRAVDNPDAFDGYEYRCEEPIPYSTNSYKYENDEPIAALANGYIYLFLLKTVQRFSLESLEWELLDPSLTCDKHTKGATASLHGNVIYFFGSDYVRYADRMCLFDTLQNKWMKEEKMPHSLCCSATAVLGDTIYVTGGKYGVHGRKNSIAQKYNVSTGQWHAIAPMNNPRAQHGSASLNGMIYVCGGLSNVPECYCSSAEMYNPLTGQWSALSSMNAARSRFSLISCGNKLYALGGKWMRRDFDGEIYDPQKDQWKSAFSVPEDIEHFVM